MLSCHRDVYFGNPTLMNFNWEINMINCWGLVPNFRSDFSTNQCQFEAISFPEIGWLEQPLARTNLGGPFKVKLPKFDCILNLTLSADACCQCWDCRKMIITCYICNDVRFCFSVSFKTKHVYSVKLQT